MPHILIVEDEQLIAFLYETVFTRRNYTVDIAVDGEEGLAKAKSGHPELILLDIMMPKMNGVKVLEALKADPETKNIPVIMSTNLADPVIEQTTKNLGAINYLIKSQHQPDEMVDIVDETFKTMQQTS